MLTFAFMHYPYLVRILFGMPSLHLFTFLMFFKSYFCTFFDVTVRPKPKNISCIDNLVVVPSM